MIRWPQSILIALLVIACDDELDLRVPEGHRPDAPVAVVFHPENASYLELRWSRIPRAVGYHVYTATLSDGEFMRVASVGDTIWRHDLSVAFAEAYSASFANRFYTVSAVVDNGESIQSGQVGTTKLVVTGSGTPGVASTRTFGLFLTAWQRDDSGAPLMRTTSTAAADVFSFEVRSGSLGQGDQIRIPDNSSPLMAWRDETGAWQGELTETGFPSGTPWIWYNYSGSMVFVYLSGMVKNGALSATRIDSPTPPQMVAITPYAWRESRSLAIDQLGLLEAGFNGGTVGSSDRVAQGIGGGFAYYRISSHSWEGILAEILPGEYYNITRKQSTGYEYYYTSE